MHHDFGNLPPLMPNDIPCLFHVVSLPIMLKFSSSLLVVGLIVCGFALRTPTVYAQTNKPAEIGQVVFPIHALLVIPSDLQKRLYPHEIAKTFDAFNGTRETTNCGGTRVLANTGVAYSQALRTAIKSLVQKVTVVSEASMPMKLSNKFDMIIECEILDEKFTTLFDETTGVVNSNIQQVGVARDQPIIHTNDGAQFAIKTKGMLVYALRIYTAQRHPLELASTTLNASTETLGECAGALTAIQATAEAMKPQMIATIRNSMAQSPELASLKTATK